MCSQKLPKSWMVNDAVDSFQVWQSNIFFTCHLISYHLLLFSFLKKDFTFFLINRPYKLLFFSLQRREEDQGGKLLLSTSTLPAAGTWCWCLWHAKLGPKTTADTARAQLPHTSLSILRKKSYISQHQMITLNRKIFMLRSVVWPLSRLFSKIINIFNKYFLFLYALSIRKIFFFSCVFSSCQSIYNLICLLH